MTDSRILLAPYVWECSGMGEHARAEATMPGAYFKALVQGTSDISLLVDGAANQGLSAAALPMVDYSIDGKEFKTLRLASKSEVYPLILAAGLDVSASHRVDVVFRSARLGGRWTASQNHLRLAGLKLSVNGKLLPRARLPRNAIAFGDSITEGVLAEGAGPFYVDLALNDARVTWVPLVCSALQSEFGQLGTGGQGMVKPIEIPPLPQTWDRYDASHSRLTGGLLLPAPDFVFCLMGTNDSETLKPRLWRTLDISADYGKWLKAVRLACPEAAIFCITPPLGLHSAQIAEAVRHQRDAGDAKTYLIDTSPLSEKFSSLPPGPLPGTYGHVDEATQLAVDGVHPSVYGNAVLGAFIAAEVAARWKPALEPLSSGEHSATP